MNGRSQLLIYVIALLTNMISVISEAGCHYVQERNTHSLANPLCSLKEITHTLLGDAFNLNRYLISYDSLKFAALFAPAYALTKHFDERCHTCFYNRTYHKNIKQLPRYCSQAVNAVLATSFISIAGLAIYASEKRLRTTAQVFILGLPFTWAAKNIIKQFKWHGCLRPRNEHFDRYKRAYGGFPSGHMLEMAYMATLFGLQFGPKWGIGFSAVASYVFVDFAIRNRHYLSQMVAGAALGAIFGVASSKLVNQKIATYEYALVLDNSCKSALQVSYTF